MFSFHPSSNDPILAWKSYIAGRTNLENINASLKSHYYAQRETANIQIQQNEAINNAISNNTDAVIKHTDMVQKMSADQIKAIEQNTINVCGSIDNGFEMLSGCIEELGSIIDLRLSTIMENQIISNLLSANIALLLKIPDFQKERQYHIEQGLKHLKNSSFDPDLYNDALENLLKAEKLEKTDYVVLYYLGLVYLYSPQNNDLVLAREYFQKALKYSLVETNENAVILANILTGDIYKKLDQNIATVDSIKNISAKISLQIGITYYIQNILNEALNYFSKSAELNPRLLEATINKIRTLVLLDKQEEARTLIEQLLREKDSRPPSTSVTATKLFPVFSTDKIISYSSAYKDALDHRFTLLKDWMIENINLLKNHIIQNSKYENELLKLEKDVYDAQTLFELYKVMNLGTPTDDSFLFCINIWNQDLWFNDAGIVPTLVKYDLKDKSLDYIREDGLSINIFVEELIAKQMEKIKEAYEKVELLKQQTIQFAEKLKTELTKIIEERQIQDKKFFKKNRDYSVCIGYYELIFRKCVEYERSIFVEGSSLSQISNNREFYIRSARKYVDQNFYDFNIEKGVIEYEEGIAKIIEFMKSLTSRYQEVKGELKSIDLSATYKCEKRQRFWD